MLKEKHKRNYKKISKRPPKIYPNRFEKLKNLPQMVSKSTLQSLPGPLWAPFGYKLYFKTLLDLIFHHFCSILASLGGPFWRALGLLFLSWGLQEPKIDEF